MKKSSFISAINLSTVFALNLVALEVAASNTQYQQLKVGHSGQCLTVKQLPVANGSAVALAKCENLTSQLWHQDSLGRVRPQVAANFCLEAGRYPQNGSEAFVWQCHQGTHQKWSAVSGVYQNKANPRMVLDASGTEQGKVITYTYHGGSNQRWQSIASTTEPTGTTGGNQTTEQSTQVSIYKHCGFNGYQVNLAPGRYTLSQLRRLGMRNDDISSIKVPKGMSAELYEHDNFKGRSWNFTGKNRCFVANGLNDIVSSLIITTDQTNKPTVPAIDTTALKNKVKQAKDVISQTKTGVANGQFYPSDVATLTSILNSAESLLNKTKLTQVIVDEAVNNLNESLQLLSTQQISHLSDLAKLYKNIDKIEYAGSGISQLSAYNFNGFLVHAKEPEQGKGTIAAGRYGEGRMMVFGRELHSYLSSLKNSSTNSNMTQFVRNSLHWLTERNQNNYAKVVVSSNEKLNVLVQWWYGDFDDSYQINSHRIDNIINNKALFNPAEYPIAIVNPRIEDPKEAEILANYVKQGGSLIMGHQVWNWDINFKAAEGQDLIAKAGIIWKGTWHWTDSISSKPDFQQLLEANLSNRFKWFKAIEEGKEPLPYSKQQSKEAETFDKTVIGAASALANLPNSAMNNLGLSEDSQTKAIKYKLYNINSKPYTKIMAYLDSATKSLKPNQKPANGYEQLGTVQADAAKVTETINFDFNQQHSSWVKTSVTNPYWLSTGLYAKAGDNIVITVNSPSDNHIKAGQPSQIEVRVNGHTDNIATTKNKDSWPRPPQVSFTQKLNVGKNVINNPYGGLIYFTTGSKHYRNAQAQLTVQGAVKAPYFKLGEHSNSDWNSTLKHYPAPWGEIHSGNMIVLLPKDQLQEISDVETYAKTWQQITNNTYKLMGLTTDGAIPHRTPSLPNRYHVDLTISAGWMHSGYPIMAYLPAKLQKLDNVKSWGPYHEVGHNYQQSDWMLPGTVEVTNNLFSLYQQEQFGQTNRIAQTYKKVAGLLEEGQGWDDITGPFERLVFYHQLTLAYGWDFYTQLYTKTREYYHQRGYAKAKNQSAADYLLVTGSAIAKEDLRSFFEKWKIEVSENAKQQVAHMELPKPKKPLWQYGI
ncbi:M60 family metallopeptidase [Spartinivicinus poritis]|uniref:M60 family metallopeptidase n=1 Tax=Spartinivicinus poritis TaxID=2994640 RepID=A0ABT5U9T1_9GAMM|nr:M60 family metallopeptidase [Spartinivicinus sp. A2-2]MDE1462223.1 M60 family metallopeptidase [Spartinivicinus sp. A2-2]